MVEMLGRYFTKKESTATVFHWCICKGMDDGRPMVRCENGDCETEWFHFDCVGLENLPNNAWICEKCDIKGID